MLDFLAAGTVLDAARFRPAKRRGLYELSEAEKRRVAEELTRPVALFGALMAAAVLVLGFFAAAPALFHTPAGAMPATHVAAQSAAGPGS